MEVGSSALVMSVRYFTNGRDIVSEPKLAREQLKTKIIELMRTFRKPVTGVQIRRLVAPVEQSTVVMSILEELYRHNVVDMTKPEPQPGATKAYRLWWLHDEKSAPRAKDGTVQDFKTVAVPKISGSIIIPKQVLSDLLTALVDCSDHFTPELEALVLTYTNKLQS